MVRRKSTTLLHLSIPEDIRYLLDNLLYDPIEKRVPQGSYAKFFSDRVREYTTWEMLPLSQYGFEDTDFIWGPRNTVLKLEQMFNKAIESNR